MSVSIAVERKPIEYEENAESVLVDLLVVKDGSETLLAESITHELVAQLELAAVQARLAYERKVLNPLESLLDRDDQAGKFVPPYIRFKGQF